VEVIEDCPTVFDKLASSDVEYVSWWLDETVQVVSFMFESELAMVTVRAHY
jgi:hypothetical protein